MDNLPDFLNRKKLPDGNGTLNKNADFMNTRKLQTNEGLIEKLRSSPQITPRIMIEGLIVLFKDSWTYCRNPTASGLSKIG